VTKEYICAECGHYFSEKPDEEFCNVCFSDSVVSADYAEQLIPSWDEEEYE